MPTVGLPGDLAWWRDHHGAPDLDRTAARAVLERLHAWKAEHDADRARQPGPFLQMVWDGIFADDASDVEDAITEIEAALAGR